MQTTYCTLFLFFFFLKASKTLLKPACVVILLKTGEGGVAGQGGVRQTETWMKCSLIIDSNHSDFLCCGFFIDTFDNGIICGKAPWKQSLFV